MTFLIDTNVPLRMAEIGHAQRQAALDAVSTLTRRGHELVVVPQNLYEFWAACTRPKNVNGLGTTPAQAAAELATLRSLFRLVHDTPSVYAEWERLVLTSGVSGKQAHDARLAAAMIVHGVGHLLTFNAADFQRFPTITAYTPDAVTKSPP
jgi:predicted nucleic acid-binding protein